MGADASIYGLIRQPTIEPLQSPEEREAKRMTLRNLAIQGEGAALGLQEKRDEIGTRRRIQDFIAANPNATADQIAPIDYRAAAGMRKDQLEADAKRATTGHTNAQTSNINAGHIAGAFAALAKGGGSDASVQAARDVLAQTVGPERAAQTMAPLLGMPPELRLAYAVQQAGIHKVGQDAIQLFFPKAELKDTGGAIVPVSTSTIPGGAAAGSVLPGATPIQKTQSPDSIASNETTRRGQNMVDARARDTLAQGGRSYDSDRGVVVNTRDNTAAPVTVGGAPIGSKEKDKALTEGQGKATTFGMRARIASDILDSVGKDGNVQPGLIKRAAESIPFVGEGAGTATNWTQSEAQQKVEQAQRDFINAVLRLESGATIQPSEFDSAKRQYFPQPGDSPGVIAQKKANRETEIAGLGVMAGPGAKNIKPAPPPATSDVPDARRASPKEQPLGGNRGKPPTRDEIDAELRRRGVIK